MLIYKLQTHETLRTVKVKPGVTTTFDGVSNVHQGRITTDTAYLVRRYVVVCAKCMEKMVSEGPPQDTRIKREL